MSCGNVKLHKDIWLKKQIHLSGFQEWLLVAYCTSDFEKKWSKNEIELVYVRKFTMNFDIETFGTYITWSFFSQSNPISLSYQDLSLKKLSPPLGILMFFKLEGSFGPFIDLQEGIILMLGILTLYILCTLCT